MCNRSEHKVINQCHSMEREATKHKHTHTCSTHNSTQTSVPQCIHVHIDTLQQVNTDAHLVKNIHSENNLHVHTHTIHMLIKL